MQYSFIIPKVSPFKDIGLNATGGLCSMIDSSYTLPKTQSNFVPTTKGRRYHSKPNQPMPRMNPDRSRVVLHVDTSHISACQKQRYYK